MPNQYLPPVITIPSSLQITAITRGFPMVITVEIANTSTETNAYQVGQSIRLNIPWTYGMWQANGLTPVIMAINGLDFSVNVDSTNFDPFVIPVSTTEAPATIAPNGSRNVEYGNTTGQIPFQSLNNIGN